MILWNLSTDVIKILELSYIGIFPWETDFEIIEELLTPNVNALKQLDKIVNFSAAMYNKNYSSSSMSS